MTVLHRRDVAWLLGAWSAVAIITAIYVVWLHVTNATIVALSFLLIVLIVAAVSTLWVSIATSLLAFVCFNFFFLPPVGTFSIADPENLAALFSLLVVSIVASHLSAQARRRASDAMALELKSALLASLSHDLRTPLTAVTVAASNLKASWLTDDQRAEQIDLVLTELERLNRLLQNIVDMAKIETRAIAAEREWVQPSDIVEAAAQQVEQPLREHPLDVGGMPDGTLVRIDPRLASAALAHVLENAAHYSPPGSPITVGISLASNELRFDVRDRGAGIAPADLDRVFDRFYRGAAAGQHQFGTGMGLAITRGLVVAQGGRVWAAHHRDGGAVFTIAVPVESRSATVLEEEPA